MRANWSRASIHVVCGCAGGSRSGCGWSGRGWVPGVGARRTVSRGSAKPPQQLAYSVSAAGKSRLKRAKVNTRPDNKSPSELFSSSCAPRPVGRQSFAGSRHTRRPIYIYICLLASVGECGCEGVLASCECDARPATGVYAPAFSLFFIRFSFSFHLLRFGFFVSSRSSSPAADVI